MNIAVFDYGAGNLHSLVKVLEGPHRTVTVERHVRRALEAAVVVLPGVGAFSAASAAMGDAHADVRRALHDGLPCLGICLGMQLLFDESDEGPGAGIGLINGRVTRVDADRVPQIGWNALDEVSDPLFARARLRTAYYANSFVCRPADSSTVVAWSTHGRDRFPAAVRAGRTLGVQFHPEKSSAPGVALIRQFLDDVLPR